MTNELVPFRLTSEEIESLRGQLLNRTEAFLLRSEPELASIIASLGIQREVLTISNELVPYIFDSVQGQPLSVSQMRSELVRFGKAVGVRIWAENTPELEIRLRGLKSLIHPELSHCTGGRLRQLVVFPESLAKILELENAELVIVPQWGLNTIFGGFDGSTHYYQTNIWELDNNDTLRFSRLLEKRQIPILGTHDLTAHISGVKENRVEHLATLGARVAETIETYFSGLRGQSRTRASLIIPYLLGVFLDDLAQPANYGSLRHEIMIEELIGVLASQALSPNQPLRIFRFPKGFRSLIQFTREADESLVLSQARMRVDALVEEILQGAIKTTD